MIRPRAFPGLLLCAFLLGATWPTLASLPAVPGAIVAGGAYAITQGSGALSVNSSLVENLTTQPWSAIVSPEILGLGTLRGAPVVIRGANPDAFLSLEAGALLQPVTLTDQWALAGEGLARRLGLSVGDTATVVGTALPRIAFVQIIGVYRTETTANDELLVDPAMARFLTGLSPGFYHTIRVKTSEPGSLLTFLQGFGASVHVSGPGLARADVNSEAPRDDERLTNLLLREGIGSVPRDYLSTAIGEATTSVRVVAYGTAAFIALLVAFGVHSIQAGGFADRVKAVGVLRAVGASDRWLRRRLTMESIPPAVLAGIVGAGSGWLTGRLLQPATSLVVFGHAVPVAFDAMTFGLIVLLTAFLSGGSALLLLQTALRVRPTESIRESVAVASPQSLEVVLRG